MCFDLRIQFSCRHIRCPSGCRFLCSKAREQGHTVQERLYPTPSKCFTCIDERQLQWQRRVLQAELDLYKAMVETRRNHPNPNSLVRIVEERLRRSVAEMRSERDRESQRLCAEFSVVENWITRYKEQKGCF